MKIYISTARQYGTWHLNHTIEARDEEPPERLTKANILDSRRRGLEAALERMNEDIAYLDQPFKDGDGKCSGCGAKLPTERAFAEHYTVPDSRYPNLGVCPNEE